ncbi:MAG: hypothetical protein AB7E77_01545 [Desulfobulbus sp.]
MIGAALLILQLCANGSVRAGEVCGPLVDSKCSTCHFVTHICPGIKTGKSSSYWKRIIANMTKNGMVATDGEKEQLARCLTDPDTTVKALCPRP